MSQNKIFNKVFRWTKRVGLDKFPSPLYSSCPFTDIVYMKFLHIYTNIKYGCDLMIRFCKQYCIHREHLTKTLTLSYYGKSHRIKGE